ncbi:uncharacterized protein LOC118218368 [Anguilla anguilla]|uniref:uncharacterized protein LOC118218368 n=1 Tax=Anguilla anguilla TaxID=7936 RepID=UPI0015B36FE4|nr:uncharacterized protein LOC118218368 [Anguilla anguilla]
MATGAQPGVRRHNAVRMTLQNSGEGGSDASGPPQVAQGAKGAAVRGAAEPAATGGASNAAAPNVNRRVTDEDRSRPRRDRSSDLLRSLIEDFSLRDAGGASPPQHTWVSSSGSSSSRIDLFLLSPGLGVPAYSIQAVHFSDHHMVTVSTKTRSSTNPSNTTALMCFLSACQETAIPNCSANNKRPQQDHRVDPEDKAEEQADGGPEDLPPTTAAAPGSSETSFLDQRLVPSAGREVPLRLVELTSDQLPWCGNVWSPLEGPTSLSAVPVLLLPLT